MKCEGYFSISHFTGGMELYFFNNIWPQAVTIAL